VDRAVGLEVSGWRSYDAPFATCRPERDLSGGTTGAAVPTGRAVPIVDAVPLRQVDLHPCHAPRYRSHHASVCSATVTYRPIAIGLSRFDTSCADDVRGDLCCSAPYVTVFRPMFGVGQLVQNFQSSDGLPIGG